MSTRALILGIPLAVALAGDAAAQAEARTYSVQPGRAFPYSTPTEDGDLAVLGVITSSGSARDTLGVLISSLHAGGPAEKAGIEEGSRIAAINGVNLKLAAVDAGDWEMAGAMSRRLARVMAKVRAGDEVELKIYTGGQTRTVKIVTVSADDLKSAGRRASRTRDVKVKTVPMSDLPHRGSISIFGGATPMAMPMPPMPPTIERRRNREDAIREPLNRIAPAVRRVVTNRIII